MCVSLMGQEFLLHQHDLTSRMVALNIIVITSVVQHQLPGGEEMIAYLEVEDVRVRDTNPTGYN